MCLTNRRPSFYRSHKDVRTCESSRLAASSTWTNANGSSSANNVGRKSRSKLPVAVKSHVELRARARFARQEKLFGEAKAVASTSRIPRPVKSPHTTASLDRRYTNSTEVLASASSNKSEDNPLASSAASSAGVFQMETDAPRRGNVSNLKIIPEEISQKKMCRWVRRSWRKSAGRRGFVPGGRIENEESCADSTSQEPHSWGKEPILLQSGQHLIQIGTTSSFAGRWQSFVAFHCSPSMSAMSRERYAILFAAVIYWLLANNPPTTQPESPCRRRCWWCPSWQPLIRPPFKLQLYAIF